MGRCRMTKLTELYRVSMRRNSPRNRFCGFGRKCTVSLVSSWKVNHPPVILPRSGQAETDAWSILLDCAGAFSPRIEDHRQSGERRASETHSRQDAVSCYRHAVRSCLASNGLAIASRPSGRFENPRAWLPSSPPSASPSGQRRRRAACGLPHVAL